MSGHVIAEEWVERVEPRPMNVLVCLATHAPDPVGREQLVNEVWKRAVTDDAINKAISDMRKALHDSPRNPRYIQTIAKRGYRLLHLPTGLTASAIGVAPTALREPPTPESASASIAVLPFDTVGGAGRQDHFGDGIASDVRSLFSRVHRLRVAPRRLSIATHANADTGDITNGLDVDYVISGTVQSCEDRIRVNVELEDTATNELLWSNSYTRGQENLLDVQNEIAESVAGSFGGERLRADVERFRALPTPTLNVWGLLQRARGNLLEYTIESLVEAGALSRQAVALAPDYAPAHAVLGAACAEQLLAGICDDPSVCQDDALAAAQTAFRIDPANPLVAKLVGTIWAYTGDWRKSKVVLTDATQMTPYDFGAWGYLGWPLICGGREPDLNELKCILERILLLAPRHPGAPFWCYHLSSLHTCLGNDNLAVEFAKKSLILNPNFPFARMQLANGLAALADVRAARDAIGAACKFGPHMTLEHYVEFIRQTSDNEAVARRRLRGLLMSDLVGL